jgi:hypothetical protein
VRRSSERIRSSERETLAGVNIAREKIPRKRSTPRVLRTPTRLSLSVTASLVSNHCEARLRQPATKSEVGRTPELDAAALIIDL